MGYYDNYLTSAHWKEIKKECREIGLFKKCIICGKTKKINIHHLNYKCLFNEDILKDLVPLCSSCHKKVHKELKNKKIKEQNKNEFKEMFLTEKVYNKEAKWIPKKLWKKYKKGKVSWSQIN